METSYETTFQKLELVLPWATLHFVGWVEPTPGYGGLRCTQPNLHFASVNANCETQQRPISEPNPKSFFFDQTGRSRPEAGDRADTINARFLDHVPSKKPKS